jgi:hypothetical protein
VRHPETADRFEADRWNAFQVDQAKFRTLVPARRQLQMLMDHGYNATPAWGILGRAVGSLGPASDLQIAVAIALDPILLVLSFALIWTTFGFQATCGALILFGTSYAFGNWFTSGAFLRFDWFAASVAGVCCLKREKWFLAGLCLASAMSLRLFPGFLIGGVAVHALVNMIRERRLLPKPHLLRFATAVAVGILALGSLSSVGMGTSESGRAFSTTRSAQGTTAHLNLGFESLTNLFEQPKRDVRDGPKAPGDERPRADVSGARRARSVGAAA